jgi:hypothetical protein
MNMNGMMAPMMNQNMMGMNQQVPNLADVDPIMINTLAPINNMNNNMMNMGQLMNSSQMAQGLGKLGQLNHAGLNIPQSFEMSEMAPPMMGMNNMMAPPPMMQQNMMTPPMMGQQQFDVGMIKNLAGLNQMKMI